MMARKKSATPKPFASTPPPYTLLTGDNRELLAALPAQSVDAIVTDPPYGFTEDAPDMAEVLKAWLAGEEKAQGRAGFMGHEWDAGVPGPATWRAVLRVLKPGGYLVAFGDARTYDLLCLAIRLAGFEIRSQIAWINGQGFPKSLDVALVYERRLCSYDEATRQWRYTDDGEQMRHSFPFRSEDANLWAGWGTDLKPAMEPIALARKPLSAPTITAQLEATGTGALHIGACRVGSEPMRAAKQGTAHIGYARPALSETPERAGRFPPNVLFSHAPGCVRVGEKQVKRVAPPGRPSRNVARQDGPEAVYGATFLNDTGSHMGYGMDGLETVEAWACADGCPVVALDAQREEERARAHDTGYHTTDSPIGYHGSVRPFTTYHYGDGGAVSRYYPQFGADAPEEAEGLPEAWACVDGCPVAALEAQSVVSRGHKSVVSDDRTQTTSYVMGGDKVFAVGRRDPLNSYDDTGTAARFFPQFGDNGAPDVGAPEAALPFLYMGKATRAERDAGCEALAWPSPSEMVKRAPDSIAMQSPRAGAGRTSGGHNTHPTVKPIGLMRWLIRLVTPPGGEILDPFGGSGSTAVAALYEGVPVTLMERDPGYMAIAQARLAYHAHEIAEGVQSAEAPQAAGQAPEAASAPIPLHSHPSGAPTAPRPRQRGKGGKRPPAPLPDEQLRLWA